MPRLAGLFVIALASCLLFTDAASSADEAPSLTQEQLTAALLTAADLPSGYQASPPSDGDTGGAFAGCQGANKGPQAAISVDSSFVESVSKTRQKSIDASIHQYESQADAATTFATVRAALAACRTVNLAGGKAKVEVVNVPALGSSAFGLALLLKEKSGRRTVTVEAIAYFEQVGSAVVGVTGLDATIGKPSVNAVQIAKLTALQVQSYQDAVEAAAVRSPSPSPAP